MSEANATIEEIDLSIEQAKELIELGKALDRLLVGPDFKLVVLDGYFKDEASRVVLMKAEPNMQNPAAQADLDRQIIAIGEFRQYLSNIRWRANQAKMAITDGEAVREEILAEEINN